MAIFNVTPQVKFPLSISRGSVDARRALASSINEQIFNSAVPNIKNGYLELSDFETALHKHLPEDKRIDLVSFIPNNPLEEGFSDLIEDSIGNCIGQTIEIPSVNGRVSGRPIVTLFHECRHVLDVLSNRKYIARIKSMHARNLFSQQYDNLVNDFYDDLLEPTPKNIAKELKRLKKKLDKFLKYKSVEEKVDCLQNLRYTLETERNAYADQYKFECKLREQGFDTEDYDLGDASVYFLFKEKIELLKQVTADIISKERHRYKNSLEK